MPTSISQLPLSDDPSKCVSARGLCEFIVSQTTARLIPLTPKTIETFEINFDGYEAITDKDKKTCSESLRAMFSELNRLRSHETGLFSIKATQHAQEFLKILFSAESTGDLLAWSKLLETIADHGHYLATLLSEKGGVDALVARSDSIGAGCSKNLGSQVTLSLLNTIFKNDYLTATLYECMMHHHAIPALNNESHWDTLSTNNPFTNPIVTEKLISPKKLFDCLTEKFCKNNLAIDDPWPLIRATVGNELADLFVTEDDFISELSNPAVPAGLAAYLIINKAQPQLLDNQQLLEERKYFEDLVQRASKRNREQEKNLQDQKRFGEETAVAPITTKTPETESPATKMEPDHTTHRPLLQTDRTHN